MPKIVPEDHVQTFGSKKRDTFQPSLTSSVFGASGRTRESVQYEITTSLESEANNLRSNDEFDKILLTFTTFSGLKLPFNHYRKYFTTSTYSTGVLDAIFNSF